MTIRPESILSMTTRFNLGWLHSPQLVRLVDTSTAHAHCKMPPLRVNPQKTSSETGVDAACMLHEPWEGLEILSFWHYNLNLYWCCADNNKFYSGAVFSEEGSLPKRLSLSGCDNPDRHDEGIWKETSHSAFGVIQYQLVQLHQLLERFIPVAHLHYELCNITFLHQTGEEKQCDSNSSIVCSLLLCQQESGRIQDKAISGCPTLDGVAAFVHYLRLSQEAALLLLGCWMTKPRQKKHVYHCITGATTS